MTHLAQLFPSARDGEALVVEKSFDDQRELDIAAAVLSMGTARLHWLENSELLFPIAEHVRANADDFSNFSDPEEELVGQLDRSRHEGNALVTALRTLVNHREEIVTGLASGAGA